MLLAWSNPRLKVYCVSRAYLQRAAGGYAEAAEDLLHVVSQAPRLEALGTFRSVYVGLQAGTLTLSIEEVEMHALPLGPAGDPRNIRNRASLLEYSTTDSLLVQDLKVRGQSVLELGE